MKGHQKTYIWFSGTLVVRGTEEQAEARWKLIQDLLAALDVGDVAVSERESDQCGDHAERTLT
jgi:hypothetical protein